MIDPTAFLAPGAVVLGDVKIGRDASIWYYCVIRGDTEHIAIDEESNIQDLCVLHADPGFPCFIGPRVTVGHRAILHGCIVEESCMIGMGAILLNGSRIGRGSVVGAGAVVPEGTDIPPGSLVLGVPAKVIRRVDDSMSERIEHAWRHYVDQSRQHKAGKWPRAPHAPATAQSGRGDSNP